MLLIKPLVFIIEVGTCASTCFIVANLGISWVVIEIGEENMSIY